MKILFLETKQNEVWVSMQEILPHIQEVWNLIAKNIGGELIVKNVDELNPSAYLKDLLNSNLIIVPAFNARMAQNLVVIREYLGIKSPWVFYLHNQATIGLWPLFALGVGKYLQSNDLFIGTCSGDQRALLNSLKNSSYYQTFFATRDDSAFLPKIEPTKVNDIVYIGRVSPQKNLHSLMMAFKLLKSEKPELKLHIYGGEDQLGSPNMQWKGEGYQKFLENLVQVEEIKGVFFHGFTPREEIKDKLRNKKFILCTASLHSDENFGMAVLSGLELGAKAVLTNWGGHKNFLKAFPERVYGVPVYLSGKGPYIAIHELRDKLKLALEENTVLEKTPSPFNLSSIVKSLENYLQEHYLKRTFSEKKELEVLPLLFELLEKRKSFLKRDSTLVQKVFDSYQDPHAHKFFSAYGAACPKDVFNKGRLVPWAYRGEEEVDVRDPHRGNFKLCEDELGPNGYLIDTN